MWWPLIWCVLWTVFLSPCHSSLAMPQVPLQLGCKVCAQVDVSRRLTDELRTLDECQVLRGLAEGCGLDEAAHSLGLGLLQQQQQQQHSSCAQNGSLQPRESMDGATPQYEQLQVLLPNQGTKTAYLLCLYSPAPHQTCNLHTQAKPCSFLLFVFI